VVGQQAITEKLYSLLLTVKRKLLQVSLSVLIVAKNRLAVVPATNNVIDAPGTDSFLGQKTLPGAEESFLKRTSSLP
jgi:hypothetical protein